MLPTPGQANRSRKDRRSVSIATEDVIGTTFCCPHLHYLFEDASYPECESSDAITPHSDEIIDGNSRENLVERLIRREMADWVELDERDSLSKSRGRWWQKSCPIAQHDHQCHNIVLLIAVQLLASCYTMQPAVSADNLPFYQQRRPTELVSSLQLHSQYRFFPAAGHHPRDSSPTSCWPGLYAGLATEERLAEVISRRKLNEQRCEQHNSGSSSVAFMSPATPEQSTSSDLRYEERKAVSDRAGKGNQSSSPGRTPKRNYWNDGPAASEPEKVARTESNSSGASTAKQLFSKLLCQRSPSTGSHHKPHSHVFNNRTSKDQYAQTHSHHADSTVFRRWKSPSRNLTSHATQRIPSAFRLRRTLSAHAKPSISAPGSPPRIQTQRNSSTPNVGGALTYPFDVPEIRRISATTMSESTMQPPLGVASRPFLDTTRLNPTSAPGSHESRASIPPMDELSPLSSRSTKTIVPDDYFGTVEHQQHAEDVTDDSQNQQREGEEDEGGIEDGSCSEDSIDMFEKRKGVTLKPWELLPSWRLHDAGDEDFGTGDDDSR